MTEKVVLLLLVIPFIFYIIKVHKQTSKACNATAV